MSSVPKLPEEIPRETSAVAYAVEKKPHEMDIDETLMFARKNEPEEAFDGDQEDIVEEINELIDETINFDNLLKYINNKFINPEPNDSQDVIPPDSQRENIEVEVMNDSISVAITIRHSIEALNNAVDIIKETNFINLIKSNIPGTSKITLDDVTSFRGTLRNVKTALKSFFREVPRTIEDLMNDQDIPSEKQHELLQIINRLKDENKLLTDKTKDIEEGFFSRITDKIPFLFSKKGKLKAKKPQNTPRVSAAAAVVVGKSDRSDRNKRKRGESSGESSGYNSEEDNPTPVAKIQKEYPRPSGQKGGKKKTHTKKRSNSKKGQHTRKNSGKSSHKLYGKAHKSKSLKIHRNKNTAHKKSNRNTKKNNKK